MHKDRERPIEIDSWLDGWIETERVVGREREGGNEE